MKRHADKTQENKSQSVANAVSQKRSNSESTFQIEDNRPEAVAQRKMQEMVNNSSQVSQFKAFEEMANKSSQSKQTAQLNSKTIQRAPFDEYGRDLGATKIPLPGMPKQPGGFMNFMSESTAGVLGHFASYVKAPSDTPSPSVQKDPTRMEFDQRLRSDAKPKPKHLQQQLLYQNMMQAHFGNVLPPNGGNALVDGLEEMGAAKNMAAVAKGHFHAQMNSLGGKGFNTAAPYLLHSLALPWQQPNLALHGLHNTPTSDPSHPFPVRDASRAAFDISDKHPVASTLFGAGAGAALSRAARFAPKQMALPLMLGGAGAMMSMAKGKLEDIEKGK